MSSVSVGYAVDLKLVTDIERADARDVIALALEDLASGRDSEELENDRAVLEQIFGVSRSTGMPFLLVAFRWFCKNFGRGIVTPHHICRIWRLELVPFPLSEFRAVVKPPLAAYVIAATA